MAQKKSHEVDGWLAKPDPSIRVVLVYGPDRGLVSERARRFAAGTGLPLDDPFSVVKLDAASIDQEPGRLSDEARTVPMFADRRLIWVLDAGSQKGLADAVSHLAAEPPRDAVLLIEAGDLKKTAALRTAVEKAAAAMALPCYADEARGLDALIDDMLGKAGLSIALDARTALRGSLGGDRLASRSEIEKLLLYCHGAGRVELDDVVAATGDAAGISADAAVDAVLTGNLAQLDLAFAQLAATGQPPFLLLSATMRQFQALLLMRSGMEQEGRSAAAAVAAARPPVFFSRRSQIQAALERRDTAALLRALKRLSDTVLETRRRPALAESLTRQALMAVAAERTR